MTKNYFNELCSFSHSDILMPMKEIFWCRKYLCTRTFAYIKYKGATNIVESSWEEDMFTIEVKPHKNQLQPNYISQPKPSRILEKEEVLKKKLQQLQ